MKESSGQRLALENGDIDVARNLEPGDMEAVSKKEGLSVTSAPKGTVYYFSLNQKNEYLKKPEVVEAFKYLVDYDGIGATLIKGSAKSTRPSCRRASWARLTRTLQVGCRQGEGTAGQGWSERRLYRDHGRA